jgi:hypothetical protein
VAANIAGPALLSFSLVAIYRQTITKYITMFRNRIRNKKKPSQNAGLLSARRQDDFAIWVPGTAAGHAISAQTSGGRNRAFIDRLLCERKKLQNPRASVDRNQSFSKNLRGWAVEDLAVRRLTRRQHRVARKVRVHGRSILQRYRISLDIRERAISTMSSRDPRKAQSCERSSMWSRPVSPPIAGT